jgi:hypothetical protein
MKCKYAVTFEFVQQAPITERGESEAGALRTIVARAIDDATEKQKGLRWSSVSILIERIEEDETLSNKSD